MFIQLSAYLIASTVLVSAMALMILRIGSLLSECPKSGRAARGAAVTIATGYSMIGLGGVTLIGSIVPVLDLDAMGYLAALGFAAICLGLGFTNAVATLRAVVREAVTGQSPVSPRKAPWSGKDAPAPESA